MELEEGLEPVLFDLGLHAAGVPGLSPAMCAGQAEAAALCFEDLQHKPGVGLEGEWEPAEVRWPPLHPNASASYEQMRATELGAEAIAIMGARQRCGFEVTARSRIGTGFDFYLQRAGDDAEDVFAEVHALEVSGTRQADPAELQRRLSVKRKQVQAGGRGIPALIVVVGFDQPTVVIEEVP
jgi:hypothetical protein